MNRSEMLEITEMLSGAYRFLDFSNEATFGIWYETLKNYEAGEVRQAVKNWAAYSAHEPTPADILDATKNVRTARRENAMDYVDWRSVETVKCPKCNDHGYMMIEYPGGYEEFRVCDCEAARTKYAGCFTDEFRQKCERISEHEKPFTDGWWKDAKYRFGIEVKKDDDEKQIREAWTKKLKRIRAIRDVHGSGIVSLVVTPKT